MGSLMDQILAGLENTKQGKLTPAKDIPSKQVPTQKAGSPPSEPPKKKSKTTYQKLPMGPPKVGQSGTTQHRKPASPSREAESTSWRRTPPSSPPHTDSTSTTERNSPDRSDSRSSALVSDRKGSSPVTTVRATSSTSSPYITTTPSSSPSQSQSTAKPTLSSSPPLPRTTSSPPLQSSNDEFQLPVCRAEPVVIRTVDETVAAIRQLKKATAVAIDCEAFGMSRHGRLCLVQVATRDAVFLFDIVEGGDAIFDRGLRWLLESPSILKIVHDCRGDSEILFYKHQVSLANVVDTQVAFCVLCRQQSGSTPIPCALNTLIKRYARGATNTFKDIVRDEMEACSNYWEIRPLSHNMIQYASQDVIYLPYVWSQLEAALSLQSKKIVMSMSIRYLNQYRSMEERPAPPPKALPSGKDQPTEENLVTPSTPQSPSTASLLSTPPPNSTPTPSTPIAPTTPIAEGALSASPVSPVTPTSPRFVPKYGIEEWDKSVEKSLEMGSSFRGSRGSFPSRRRRD